MLCSLVETVVLCNEACHYAGRCSVVNLRSDTQLTSVMWMISWRETETNTCVHTHATKEHNYVPGEVCITMMLTGCSCLDQSVTKSWIIWSQQITRILRLASFWGMSCWFLFFGLTCEQNLRLICVSYCLEIVSNSSIKWASVCLKLLLPL